MVEIPLLLVLAIVVVWVWATFSARKNKEENLGTFVFNTFFKVGSVPFLIFLVIAVIVGWFFVWLFK